MRDATLDIAYDLCRTCLGTPGTARKIVRIVERKVKRANGQAYVAHRIPWLLSIAYRELASSSARPVVLSADEQLALDNAEDAASRLHALWFYFQRLPLLEKVVLLLLHKHGVSREHTSSALGIPLDSLKLTEDQALGKLLSWIWPGIDQAKDGARRLGELTAAISESSWADPTENDPDRFIDPKTGKVRWKKAPWYLRFGLEGLGLTAIALAVVMLIPRIRLIYEDRLSEQLKAADLSELAMSQASWDGTPDLGETTPDREPETLDSSLETLDGTSTRSPSGADNSKLKVGAGEIWRFNLKTDSPKDLRISVARALEEIGAKSDDGLGGVAAPGGVQFISLAPKDKVIALKTRLEELARSAQTKDTLIRDSFAWVKSRSRVKIPDSDTRIVIWISQI